MGRYVSSVSDTESLNKSIKKLEKQFDSYKTVVKRNNKELAKINQLAQDAKDIEIRAKSDKIDKFTEQTTQ